jgi:MATE family multidrug resistance protein
MGAFGKDLLAANQIVMQYFGTLMAIIFSIAQAITVRMGHLLGENNTPSAERAAYCGIAMAGIFIGFCAIAFLFYSTTLIALDLDIHDANNLQIFYYAKQFFVINALFMILEATRISLFGALRGLKDTRFTLLTSIISFWCIALPLGYFFAKYLDLKGAGLWWGMVLGGICSVLLLFWRFKSKIHHFN